MKHWTLCLGVMNIFRGGGERLAVFQPSNIQPSFSHSLCAAILCVIFETCRTSFLVLHSHIFPNIPERREPQVSLNSTFFPLHILPPFGDSPFFMLRCRHDWLWVSGKPVARSSCLLNVFSGLQSEEKPLTKPPRKRICYLCTPAAVHMRCR